MSSQDYASLPKIYNFSEPERCPENHLYCKFDVRLKPINEKNPPRIWELMEKINYGDKGYYRRDLIYRGVCIEANGPKNEIEEFKKDGFIGLVDKAYCTSISRKGWIESLYLYDIFLALVVASYITFLIYCTIRSHSRKKELSGTNKYLKIFSVVNIWEDIRKPNRNEDFNRLLFIQGIRTLAMMVIIMTHSFFGMVLTFSRNPEYLEDFHAIPYSRMLISIFSLIVQTYFTISAWLLAMQLHNIVKQNGVFTIKDAFVIFINRYFRLIPAVICVIFLHSTKFAESLIHPVYSSLLQLHHQNCRNNWWGNILFIQNTNILQGNICSPESWYLAADTQMYILVIALFYLSHKLKVPMDYFLAAVICYSVPTQAYNIMSSNYDALLYFNPRLLPPEGLFTGPVFLFSYASTLCQLFTYMIGFKFGTIYSKNKDKNIFDNYEKKLFWYMASIGLPVIAVNIYTYNLSRMMEAVIAVFVRPIFSLGIAIGMLGMATGTDSFLKRFFEWQPLVFLGNFTYSVYMFHFVIIFMRLLSASVLPTLDDTYFLKNVVINILLSFSLGTLMYIILEHPFIQLQKMILPQIKKKVESVKTKNS